MSGSPSDAKTDAASTEQPTARSRHWSVWILRVGAVLAGVVLLFVVVSFFLPSRWEAERSIVIDAPPEVVFGHVNKLSDWAKWTAWNNEAYPELTYSYEGSESGVGAVQKWDDPQMGPGSLKITSSVPNESIDYDLFFGEAPEPIEGGFQFESTDAGVKVTWSAGCDIGYNPIERYFGLLLGGMIGADFEEGLSGLKELSEKHASTEAPSPAGA